MSLKSQSDYTGIGRSTNYVMLDNYCGNTNVPLGVKNVAPNFAPYGADPLYQNIPVFMGTNYEQAPYENPRMFCGSCGGSYCNALAGYHWPVDKNGNPLPDAVYNKDGGRVSGYAPVAYASATPTTMINQQYAISGNFDAGFTPRPSGPNVKPYTPPPRQR